MPMTNHQRTVRWLTACGKEPGNTQHLSTQIGVDLEEVAEYMQCLRVSKDGWARLLDRLVVDLNDLAKAIKSGDLVAHFPKHLREQVLDGLCDREVTANGVAWLAQMDKDAADQAVLNSNDSKLNADGTAVILPGGKIGKSSRYTAPNLTPFI